MQCQTFRTRPQFYIRMWLYNKLSLRVIFTYDYTPPKPHFSTRIPIGCQLDEHANKLLQKSFAVRCKNPSRSCSAPPTTLLPRLANLLSKRSIKYAMGYKLLEPNYPSSPKPPMLRQDKTRQWWETDAGTSASISVSLLHIKLITKLNFSITFWSALIWSKHWCHK